MLSSQPLKTGAGVRLRTTLSRCRQGALYKSSLNEWTNPSNQLPFRPVYEHVKRSFLLLVSVSATINFETYQYCSPNTAIGRTAFRRALHKFNSTRIGLIGRFETRLRNQDWRTERFQVRLTVCPSVRLPIRVHTSVPSSIHLFVILCLSMHASILDPSVSAEQSNNLPEPMECRISNEENSLFRSIIAYRIWLTWHLSNIKQSCKKRFL